VVTKWKSFQVMMVYTHFKTEKEMGPLVEIVKSLFGGLQSFGL